MYQPQKMHWEEKFSVGDENLDFQHKYLFETFNRLGEAIARDEGAAHISAILGRLRFYSDWHFAKEEECMERYRCPMAQANQRAHENFRELFGAYYDEYVNTGGSRELAIRIHESLSDWLRNHVLTVDSGLRACVHPTE